jgi:outer membrane lipase/esterase
VNLSADKNVWIPGTEGRTGAVVALVALAAVLLTPGPAVAQSSDAVLNENQQSVDAAVRRVCPRLAGLVRAGVATTDEQNLFVRCNRVINAQGGVPEQSPALQALTAEEANTAQTNIVEIGTANRSAIAARLVTLRNAGAGAALVSNQGPGQFSYSTTGGAAGDADGGLAEGRLGLFLQGFYGSGDKDPTKFEDGYDISSTGVTAGVDYRFTENSVVGFAIGYNKANSDFTKDSIGDNLDGSFDSDGLTGSLFGSWNAYDGFAYLDLIASFGNVDYDSKRHIVYTVDAGAPLVINGEVIAGPVDNVDSIASGSTSGDVWSLGMSTGLNFDIGALSIGPQIALNYLDVNVDGFTEKGAGEAGLDLKYGRQSAESFQTQLGFGVTYAISTGAGVFVPYGSATWINEMINDQNSFRLRYVSDPCARSGTNITQCSYFDVVGDEPDTSFYRWSVGVSAVFANGFGGFIDYTALAGLSTVSYGEATIGLRYQFR